MSPQPITSPRCHNCRRRKKKCDYKRPSCTRCITTGKKCEGYERELVFVEHSHSAGQAKPVAAVIKSSPKPQDISLGPFYKAHVWNEFLCFYLPWQDGWRGHTFQWLDSISNHRDNYRVLDLSVAALCTRAIGQHNGDVRLQHSSLRNYLAALQLVTSPARAKHDLSQMKRGLFTSVVMQITEMIDSATSNPAAWIQHIFGSSAYLQMGGPEMLQQDEMHFMFLCHRTSAIMASIIMERPPLIATKEWKDVPFEGRKKTSLQTLFDIMLDIPMLLAISAQMSDFSNSEGSATVLKLGHHFSRMYTAISSALDTWYATLRSQVGKEAFLKSSAAYLPAQTITSQHRAMTQVLMNYWAARLTVDEALDRARQTVSGATFNVAFSLPTNDISQLLSDADSMIALIPGCISTENGILGLFCMALPLRAVWKFCQREKLQDRLKQCQAFRMQMLSTGYPMARIALDDYRSPESDGLLGTD